MIMANANLCTPCCERNWFPALHFTQNSHNSFGFSFFPSPISRTDFNVGDAKIRVLRYRGNKCGAIKASSKGESDIRLPNGNLLEKDFQFKPSFDEYVKAMESVRTRRYKKQSDDPNKLKMKENVSAKNAESSSVYKTDRQGEVDSSLDDPNKLKMKENTSAKSGESTSMSKKTKATDVQGNVVVRNMFNRVDRKYLSNNTERITHKKDLSGNKFDNKRKGVSRSKDEVKGKVTPFDSQIYAKQHEEKRKESWSNYIEPKVRRSNNETLVHFKSDTLDVKRERHRVRDGNSMKTSERIWADDDTKPAKDVLKVGKSGVQLARNYIPGDDVVREKAELSYRWSSKSGRRLLEFNKESSLEVEHAAFNKFDALDIMDKPRVSKMEMEERIQMLSNRFAVLAHFFQ